MHTNQIQQRNFKDEIFADDKLTAKTAEITSLENLYVYIYIYIIKCGST